MWVKRLFAEPALLCAPKPQFLYGLLSVSLQEALALFSSPSAVSVMQMSCVNLECAVASMLLLSKPVEKKCVTVNVMCLYLPCRVILPQLLTAQRLREAF